jgi:hypothetical protein
MMMRRRFAVTFCYDDTDIPLIQDAAAENNGGHHAPLGGRSGEIKLNSSR